MLYQFTHLFQLEVGIAGQPSETVAGRRREVWEEGSQDQVLALSRGEPGQWNWVPGPQAEKGM